MPIVLGLSLYAPLQKQTLDEHLHTQQNTTEQPGLAFHCPGSGQALSARSLLLSNEFPAWSVLHMTEFRCKRSQTQAASSAWSAHWPGYGQDLSACKWIPQLFIKVSVVGALYNSGLSFSNVTLSTSKYRDCCWPAIDRVEKKFE